MGKLSIPCGAILLALCAQLPQVHADTILNTIPNWNGSNGVSSFGVDDEAIGSTTYGQVVTVPENGNSILKSFGFEMKVPTDLVFRAEVFAWDPVDQVATGSSLYQSPQTSSTNASVYQLISFNTGSLNLVAGNPYILFVTASVDFSHNIALNGDTGAGDGSFGSPNNPADAYTGAAGGAPSKPSQDLFFYINDEGDTSEWTNPIWVQWLSDTKVSPSIDNLAFDADFAPSGATPLPSTLLGGAALLGTLALLKTRRGHQGN